MQCNARYNSLHYLFAFPNAQLNCICCTIFFFFLALNLMLKYTRTIERNSERALFCGNATWEKGRSRRTDVSMFRNDINTQFDVSCKVKAVPFY